MSAGDRQQFSAEWKRFINACTKNLSGQWGEFAAAERGEWVFVVARREKAKAVRRMVKRWGGTMQVSK